MYRHGRKVTDGASIPLGVRWKCQYFEHHYPLCSRQQGDEIAVIFRLFLKKISEHGYVDRMPSRPKVCEDPISLHRLWWPKFDEHHQWDGLTMDQKKMHFTQWRFRKFSIDPYGQHMIPWLGVMPKARNEANWCGFWLSDGELIFLVDSISRCL